MNYASLLYTIPGELRSLFRKYEDHCKKVINNEWSTKFNTICLEEEILPSFSKLHLRDPAVAETKQTLKYRRYLVEKELENKIKHKTELELHVNKAKSAIETFVCNDELKAPVYGALHDILNNYKNVVKIRTINV